MIKFIDADYVVYRKCLMTKEQYYRVKGLELEAYEKARDKTYFEKKKLSKELSSLKEILVDSYFWETFKEAGYDERRFFEIYRSDCEKYRLKMEALRKAKENVYKVKPKQEALCFTNTKEK